MAASLAVFSQCTSQPFFFERTTLFKRARLTIGPEAILPAASCAASAASYEAVRPAEHSSNYSLTLKMDSSTEWSAETLGYAPVRRARSQTKMMKMFKR